MAASVQEDGIPDIGREIVDDVRRLIGLELRLARAEAKRTVVRFAVEIALFLVAGVFVLLGLTYAILAVPEALGALGHWWGWLATAAAVLLVAALVGGVGALRMRRTIRAVRTTVDHLKGDAEWARQLPKRSKSSS